MFGTPTHVWDTHSRLGHTKVSVPNVSKCALTFGTLTHVWDTHLCLGHSLVFGTLTCVWDTQSHLGHSLMFGTLTHVWDNHVSVPNVNVLNVSECPKRE